MCPKAVLTVFWHENTVQRSATHGTAVMNPTAPLVHSLDQDLHFVLCAFGRAGLAYVETDPAEADATTIVRALLRGLYDRPLRVVALNAEEGWSRDVSEAIGSMKTSSLPAGRSTSSKCTPNGCCSPFCLCGEQGGGSVRPP